MLQPRTRHYLVSGRVQGVGYRAFTQRIGLRLALKGWVRNLADGRVEALAQGSLPGLKEFHDELLKGPRLAQVLALEVKEIWKELKLTDFKVVEDGEAPWQVES